MKLFCSALLCCAFAIAPSAFAKGSRSGHASGKSAKSGERVTVREHVTKDGTVVEQHQRTAPNQTQRDNWSAKGNTNPNTGKEGTKEPAK